MSASQTRTESKTADELLFNHYLRTGQRLTGQAAQAFLETKGYVAPDRPVQQKSAEMVLFEHYLRTGQRLYGDAAVQFVERKYNHNHDPEDGRFTIGTGGGSLARSSAVQPFRTPRTVAALPTHMAALSHLSVQPMMAARPKPKPNPAPTPPPWARTHPGERLPVWHPRDRSTERGLPADWRYGAKDNMQRDEVERRADNAQHQFFYNWGRGMSVGAAAAWAANSEVESRSDHRTNQEGGAPGKGLFQWEKPGRADKFEALFHIPIEQSTRDQQHAFREWELRNEFRRAKLLIDTATSAGEKARLISLKYLKPASGEITATDRANIAETIMRRIRPK